MMQTHSSRPSLLRRAAFMLSLAAAALAAPVSQAAYPDRPIQLVFPWSGGTVIHSFTRALADGVGKRLGQEVVVVVKPGGNTIIGAHQVRQAPADGYTLLIGSDGTFAINTLRADAPYETLRDFTPVAHVAAAPLFLLVNNDSPINDLSTLIAQARQNPRITYGSTGVGSLASLAMERLAQQAGVRFVHVPYKGSSEVVTALQGGHIQFAYNGGLANVKQGRAKPIAVSTGVRHAGAPDVPTVAEAAGLPGYDESAWWGIVAPSGTPPAIVARLNAAIQETLAEPLFRQQFSELGFDPAPSSPEALAEKIAESTRKWRTVIDQAGIAIR